MRTMAKTAGQSPSRQADSPLTTVGGGRAWVAMQLTSWGKPDAPPHPHPLKLRLLLIIVAGIWRREDASAMMALTLLLSIIIAQEEEEEESRAGKGIVDGRPRETVVDTGAPVVAAARPRSHRRCRRRALA